MLLSSCGGIDVNRSFIGVDRFHPQKIVVLPIRVGSYDMSREIVEYFVARKLAATGWYKDVVDSQMVQSRLSESPVLLRDVSDFVVSFNTLGVSNRLLAQKLGEVFQAQALLLVNVNDWGYGRVEGEKAAKVGLTLNVVDSNSGDLIWKGSHRLVEEYMIFRPNLDDICEKLVVMMIEEMPH